MFSFVFWLVRECQTLPLWLRINIRSNLTPPDKLNVSTLDFSDTALDFTLPFRAKFYRRKIETLCQCLDEPISLVFGQAECFIKNLLSQCGQYGECRLDTQAPSRTILAREASGAVPILRRLSGKIPWCGFALVVHPEGRLCQIAPLAAGRWVLTAASGLGGGLRFGVARFGVALCRSSLYPSNFVDVD